MKVKVLALPERGNRRFAQLAEDTEAAEALHASELRRVAGVTQLCIQTACEGLFDFGT